MDSIEVKQNTQVYKESTGFETLLHMRRAEDIVSYLQNTRLSKLKEIEPFENNLWKLNNLTDLIESGVIKVEIVLKQIHEGLALFNNNELDYSNPTLKIFLNSFFNLINYLLDKSEDYKGLVQGLLLSIDCFKLSSTHLTNYSISLDKVKDERSNISNVFNPLAIGKQLIYRYLENPKDKYDVEKILASFYLMGFKEEVLYLFSSNKLFDFDSIVDIISEDNGFDSIYQILFGDINLEDEQGNEEFIKRVGMYPRTIDVLFSKSLRIKSHTEEFILYLLNLIAQRAPTFILLMSKTFTFLLDKRPDLLEQLSNVAKVATDQLSIQEAVEFNDNFEYTSNLIKNSSKLKYTPEILDQKLKEATLSPDLAIKILNEIGYIEGGLFSFMNVVDFLAQLLTIMLKFGLINNVTYYFNNINEDYSSLIVNNVIFGKEFSNFTHIKDVQVIIERVFPDGILLIDEEFELKRKDIFDEIEKELLSTSADKIILRKIKLLIEQLGWAELKFLGMLIKQYGILSEEFSMFINGKLDHIDGFKTTSRISFLNNLHIGKLVNTLGKEQAVIWDMLKRHGIPVAYFHEVTNEDVDTYSVLSEYSGISLGDILNFEGVTYSGMDDLYDRGLSDKSIDYSKPIKKVANYYIYRGNIVAEICMQAIEIINGLETYRIDHNHLHPGNFVVMVVPNKIFDQYDVNEIPLKPEYLTDTLDVLRDPKKLVGKKIITRIIDFDKAKERTAA